jgi:hypothetical protein
MSISSFLKNVCKATWIANAEHVPACSCMFLRVPPKRIRSAYVCIYVDIYIYSSPHKDRKVNHHYFRMSRVFVWHRLRLSVASQGFGTLVSVIYRDGTKLWRGVLDFHSAYGISMGFMIFHCPINPYIGNNHPGFMIIYYDWLLVWNIFYVL